MSATWDVLVVGGGAIGLASAWRASQRELSVCVLERELPPRGASWFAAGMVATATEAEVGEEALLELSLRAAAAWPGFAEELGLPFRRIGTLAIALDRDEAEELQRRGELRSSLGLASEWLPASRCRELEPGLGSCAGGLLAPDEGEVDPRVLVSTLAGQVTMERAEVTEGVWRGDRLAGVRTADGREIRSGVVVLATGCWGADWLPPEARPPVRPVKGQILRLRGPAVCERTLRSERVYLTPRATGELVVGATVEERGFDTTVTAGAVHELLREAYRLLPEVAELELVEAGAALRPGSPDNAPMVGRGAVEGLVVATGHYRNGILLAPITADAVAALCAGEEPVGWEAFTPRRFAEALA